MNDHVAAQYTVNGVCARSQIHQDVGATACRRRCRFGGTCFCRGAQWWDRGYAQHLRLETENSSASMGQKLRIKVHWFILFMFVEGKLKSFSGKQLASHVHQVSINDCFVRLLATPSAVSCHFAVWPCDPQHSELPKILLGPLSISQQIPVKYHAPRGRWSADIWPGQWETVYRTILSRDDHI